MKQILFNVSRGIAILFVVGLAMMILDGRWGLLVLKEPVDFEMLSGKCGMARLYNGKLSLSHEHGYRMQGFYENPVILEKEDIGIVNSKPGEIWVELYDKNQQEIISLMTVPENLNDDRFHPVNILQEEHKAFIAWKDAWMEEINAANDVIVTGKVKKPIKKK